MTLIAWMTVTVVFFVAVMLGAAVALGVLGRRIHRDALPRATSLIGGFGIRTPATIASDRTWAAAHRAALPFIWATVAACVIVAVIAIVGSTLRGPLDGLIAASWSTPLVVVLSLVMIIRADVAARGVARSAGSH